MGEDPATAGRKSVVIEPRFVGPPGSANGGYACGLTASALGAGSAEATLRAPPPVATPLDLEVRDGRATLSDRGQVVAEATSVELDLAPPQPVSFAEACAAAEGFDRDAYEARHAFPGCFTCGPQRQPGNGLRLFPGRVGRGGPFVAWPLTVEAWHCDAGGRMDRPLVWAALDCLGAWAWLDDPRGAGETVVLGRLAARIERLPEEGERLAVGAWTTGREGRRLGSATAIWDGGGDLVACGRATWISLTPEQAEGFGSARPR